MQLTKEQIEFLDKTCGTNNNWKISNNYGIVCNIGVHANDMNLTEIPVKFGTIYGYVNLINNKLTSLESFEGDIKWGKKLYVAGNDLGEWFKPTKRKDFKYWHKLEWTSVLEEYPFMINRAKSFLTKEKFRWMLTKYPQTKLYYKG